MQVTRLESVIGFCFRAYSTQARKPSKAFRKWDGCTPYAVHPTWCAMTLLSEARIPKAFRYIGAEALLLHDILEDTTAELPTETSEEVRALVHKMTFDSSEEEKQKLWLCEIEVLLLKLYDKTHNHLESSFLTAAQVSEHAAIVMRLCAIVESHYGELNITRIARAATA